MSINYTNNITSYYVKPTTMKTYLFGSQRTFKYLWEYIINIFKEPIFVCPKFGFLPVLDNLFVEQQSKGLNRTAILFYQDQIY